MFTITLISARLHITNDHIIGYNSKRGNGSCVYSTPVTLGYAHLHVSRLVCRCVYTVPCVHSFGTSYMCLHVPAHAFVKPLSHRIVRLLDRTIGCYLANVRPIGNVCYDRQQRSHTAIGLYSWW